MDDADPQFQLGTQPESRPQKIAQLLKDWFGLDVGEPDGGLEPPEGEMGGPVASRGEVIQQMPDFGGGGGPAPPDLDGDGQVDIGRGRVGRMDSVELAEYVEALDQIERQKEQLRSALADLDANEAMIRREMGIRGIA